MKPSPKAAQTEFKQTCRLRLHQDEIGNISEDLGSSAQSNFTRFFQLHTGTSPNQYRRVMADLG